MNKHETHDEHDITLSEFFKVLAAAKTRYQLLFIFIVLFIGGVLGSLWENDRVVPYYQDWIIELKEENKELKNELKNS